MSSLTLCSCPRGLRIAQTLPANTNRKPFCSSTSLTSFSGVSWILGFPQIDLDAHRKPDTSANDSAVTPIRDDGLVRLDNRSRHGILRLGGTTLCGATTLCRLGTSDWLRAVLLGRLTVPAQRRQYSERLGLPLSHKVGRVVCAAEE